MQADILLNFFKEKEVMQNSMKNCARTVDFSKMLANYFGLM
jgi:hypothetical protein